MTDHESDVLLENPEPGVCIVRLNRPNKLNAVTLDSVRELRCVLEGIAADRDCRIVILTGAGRGFCAGQDLHAANTRYRDGAVSYGVAEKMVVQELFSGLVEQIRRMPQPVIAAVNGAAAGVGFALALAADIRIGSATVRFVPAAINLGITAGESGISYHLPRLIGASRAFDILLTGRHVDAQEAERIGLVSRLVEGDALLTEVLELARSIIAHSPFAVNQTKSLMWQNLDAPDLHTALELENRTQVLAASTSDYREAVSAFVERRRPVFTGS